MINTINISPIVVPVPNTVVQGTFLDIITLTGLYIRKNSIKSKPNPKPVPVPPKPVKVV